MDFNAWLVANDIDPESLSAKARVKLEAQWRNEQDGGVATATSARAPNEEDGELHFRGKVRSIEAEAERVAAIREYTVTVMEPFARAGNRPKVEQLRELAEAACIDPKVDFREFQLAIMRAGRVDAPNPFTKSDAAEPTAKVVEAAVCRRAGLDNIEKYFDARTLEESERHFKRGLTLVGLLAESARRHGWRGPPDVESKDFLRAAFGQQGGDSAALDLRAGTTGPSTYSLPNILGNIANKYLKAGFLSIDNTWSRIAYRRTVNDFKAVTGTRLNGATMYRPLAPSGEIKHATLTESTYANKASTYAIMIGINREDLINDDQGAFTELSKHMGRGAGLKINDLFWTAFLNNALFFTAANNNVSTGAGSALGAPDGAAINAAETKFINQTDPNGYPVAIMPKIMLVPPTLANTARRWMGSFGMTSTAAGGQGDSNIFNGRYSVETSPYMENANYTGNSNAAWYLLANPDDEPVIEGVAVGGKWEPVVETADADFNQLGMAMRGFIDVGFSLYEIRGGVRSAGS